MTSWAIQNGIFFDCLIHGTTLERLSNKDETRLLRLTDILFGKVVLLIIFTKNLALKDSDTLTKGLSECLEKLHNRCAEMIFIMNVKDEPCQSQLALDQLGWKSLEERTGN